MTAVTWLWAFKNFKIDFVSQYYFDKFFGGDEIS